MSDHACCSGDHDHGKAPAAPPAAPAKGATYTCPMHPDVVQDAPGDCPRCGMALERVPGTTPAAAATEWTCPMHPEIVRAEPGDCPICGMALEPRAPAAGEDDEENPELDEMRRRFWPSLRENLTDG